MTTATLTLTEFLLARIAEDEVVARAVETDWDDDDSYEQDLLHRSQPHTFVCGWRQGEGMARECECGYPARVLTECEAKRRIVELKWHHFGDEDFAGGMEYAKEQVLELMALPYADHPDYRSEWRP